MPGTTPIYGFPYPEPSDLVANYPTLGQDLAEEVETVISGLSAGLDVINTTTFSAVSSVSVDGCFSASYDNYRIILYCNSSSTSPDLILRNRVAGSDESTSNYTFQRSIIRTSLSATQTVNTTSMAIPQAHDGVKAASVIEVLGPKLSQPTVYLCSGYNSFTSGTNFIYAGALNTTTSADGYTLAVSGPQTITGTISVYGYSIGA
jgi:hypothetical protein